MKTMNCKKCGNISWVTITRLCSTCCSKELHDRYWRLLNYLERAEYWFVFSVDLQEETDLAVNNEVLQPLNNIVPNRNITIGFYVSTNVKSTQDLCQFLKNLLGIKE